MSSVSASNATVGRVTLSRRDFNVPAQPTVLTIRRRASWSNFVFRFIHAFELSGFVYFVTVQREYPWSDNSPLVTRLVRMCPRDASFHSYTELTLQCDRTTTSAIAGQATAAQLASQVRSVVYRGSVV